MAKMNFGDLLSFVKAGWGPSDVKEILTMEIPEPKNSEAPAKENDPEDVKKEQEQKTQEEKPTQVSTATQSDAEEKIIDYKLELEKANETIKKLQEANTKKDMSGNAPSDPLSSFDDALRSMM